MEIRDEEPADRGELQAALAAAFGRPDEAGLVDRLRRDAAVELSLVAVGDGRILGHVLLSRLGAPFPALALAPLAIVPERQRRGIGSALVRAAIARAAAADWQALFVLGDPGFYRRFGFDPDLAAGFASPYAGPHFMALSLHGALPIATGRIDHPAAFAALD